MINAQNKSDNEKVIYTITSKKANAKGLEKVSNGTHQQFYCKHCHYTAKRKCDIQKHFNTEKHKRNTKNSSNNVKQADKMGNYICECGKSYKHVSSLARHKNICSGNVYTSKLVTVLEENNKLQEQIIEMQKEVIESQTKGSTLIENAVINNNNNRVINIQMFLNEQCADAMSIQNFTQDLIVTIDDLDKNKKDCITNIVLKSLKPLTIKERPFHCKNVKRQEWYVKDENDGWEEDNGEKVIQSTENGIIKKWAKEFEKKYPEWMKNEGLQEKYCKIAGSTSCELPEKLKIKLLAELGEEVLIDGI
tara:strand:+ start:5192 stop:6109 length:918 start_codon:yes stop_codon:yes gene_type:complete